MQRRANHASKRENDAMKKIIHFSDVHVGYGDLGRRFLYITENVIFDKQPAEDYVIVITGDLIDNALNATNFEEMRLYLEKLKHAGFEVLVVPGNHDYGTGACGFKRYVDHFKNVYFGDNRIGYPKLDIIDEVAFIGLDSMAEELDWYDRLFAQGELGKPQLDRLDKMLAAQDVAKCAKRVVYLHHHPFDPRFLHQLKDGAMLGEILKRRGNVDVLLYGHNHEGKIRNGTWGIGRCYDAGSTTRKNGDNGFHRVIDLTRDARWDYDGNFHGPVGGWRTADQQREPPRGRVGHSHERRADDRSAHEERPRSALKEYEKWPLRFHALF
jgi:3',5'-cyclic AMP phosphodiesterase CpdA